MTGTRVIIGVDDVIGVTPPDAPPISRAAELAFTGIVGLALLAAVIVVVRHSTRMGDRAGPLLLIGGLLALPQESMVDTLGNMYIPDSHLTALTTYGREMGVWTLFAYGIWFGFFGWLYYTAAMHRRDRAFFAKLAAGSLLAECIFDGLMANSGIYYYYGHQPLRVLGDLPLHWITLNLCPAWIGAAVVFRSVPHLGHGLKLYLGLPFLFVGTVAGSYVATGWPVFSVMHTANPAPAAGWFASAVTFMLGAAVIHTAIGMMTSRVGHVSAGDQCPLPTYSSAMASASTSDTSPAKDTRPRLSR